MLPFEGIRVLDLTHVFAGPFSTFQLAVLGAEVIKIEPFDKPDMTRFEGPTEDHNLELMGLQYQAQNGGKKCMSLNLKSSEGQEILTRLIISSDVLVHNYSLNAAVRLGLTHERLKKVNPKVIFCSISGYGHTGPKAEHPAYDIVVQAYTGSMYANGTAQTAPVRIGPAVIDYGTGSQTAFAIAGALFKREKTQKGCSIDVAMSDCALMLMNFHTHFTLETGKPPAVIGNNDPMLAAYGCYEAATGLIMIGAFTNKQMARLMRILGNHKRAEEILNCPRSDIVKNYKEDREYLMSEFLKFTAENLEEKLNDHHIPAARVRTLDEALCEEQITSRNILQKIDGRTLTTAGFTYSDEPPTIKHAPRTLAADNEIIMFELGYTAAEINGLRKKRVI